MLRPGEYCKSNDNNPLELKDVKLLIGQTHIAVLSSTIQELQLATHSLLTFDTQKNRERGEVLAIGEVTDRRNDRIQVIVSFDSHRDRSLTHLSLPAAATSKRMRHEDSI